MWYSIELQATTPVPEWDGQRVRIAQEEDVDHRRRRQDALGAAKRQDRLHLVR